MASMASLGNPSARAITFAEPPGIVASIGRSVVPGVEHAVDCLVDGPVAAERDEQVEPMGVGAESLSVAAMGRGDDLEVELVAQRAGDHVTHPG